MTYESHFEGVSQRAIIISDLIEQILLVDEVIARHKAIGSTGYEIEQYVERQDEFKVELNRMLYPYNMVLTDKEAA